MLRILFVAAFAVLFFASSFRVQAAELPSFSLDDKTEADLDRTWKRLQKRDAGSGSRDIYNFLLTATAYGWRPEKLGAVIDLAEELHENDPRNPNYGNYRWYWRDKHPNDLNAVEFCMSAAGLTWVVYRDRLPADAREKLSAALDLGVEGMSRHKVDVSYTNIFLMRLANCILIGQSADQPELVQRGRAWLDEWLDYTRANGIHEFSSSTYYGVDLADLGALARYARDDDIRAKAEAALRLFWTDIAANFFDSYEGIAGAHSRDYGFLTGHGYLDQFLFRAHWIAKNPNGESHPALDDLVFVEPPADVRATIGAAPRIVSQKWGTEPWQRATHYIGRHFSLGTAGGSYGPQDKVLALTLGGGPQMPIVNFSLDFHRDPYGQEKISDHSGHPKLTHLVPFVASVQRGPEALLFASFEPKKSGKDQPQRFAGVWANFVLPASAELWDARGRIAADGIEQRLDPASPLFLRLGDTAAALRFVLSSDDEGRQAKLVLAHDGDSVGAQRFTAVLAEGTPRRRVFAAVWVRAAEGLADDAAFAKFRQNCLESSDRSVAEVKHDRVAVTVPGQVAPLKLVVDLEKNERIAVEGADPALERGILNINGREFGAACLK